MMLESIKKVWNFSTERQPQLVKIMALSFVEGFFIMLKMVAVIFTVDALFHRAELASITHRVILFGVLCVAGVFSLGYFTQLGSVRTGFGIVKDKRLYFGEFLKKRYLGFFNETSVGAVNTALTTSLSYLEQVAPILFIHVIGGLLSSLSILLGFIYYERRIAVLLFFGMLAYLAAVNWQIRVSRREAPKRQSAQMKLASACIEFIQGIGVIKTFGMMDKDQKIKDSIRDSCLNNIHLSDQSLPSGICAGLTVRFFEALILLVSFLMWRSGTFSPQKTVNLFIVSFVVFQSLNQAGSILSMIGLMDGALKEVEELETAEELEIMSPTESVRSNEIEFKNVSFSYGDVKVLKNISTTISPGSMTAIIGDSGSGKSTFCKLIPRFYDTDEGEIRIGGARVTNIATEELMRNIGMVFQNVYLFEDTVWNNIKFAKPDASDEEVIFAAKKAGCHDFIERLPQGYHTVVGEAGDTLSGGEKQRIAIARALLKDAPIFILDEFTSALDAENQQEILSCIENLKKDKTVIVIAHRLETIRNADHIIVLHEGRIVQEGTHEQLIHQEGRYRDFVSARERVSRWKFK